MDREIRKMVWSAVVPVCFKLATSDVASASNPFPLYMLLPRLSYFPLVYDKLKQHFLPSSPTLVDELWLDFNREPLRWQFPVGVLFDMFGQAVGPMQISVHFSGFPDDRIMRLTGPELVKTMFMSSLKEANYLKHGDGSRVMSISKQHQDALYHSLGNADLFDEFYQANDLLLGEPATLKSCAVRLIMQKGNQIVQRPVKPLKADGTQTTLKDALETLGVPADKIKKVRVQGVFAPLDAPVFGLMATMAYGDGFLYCCIDP